VTRLFLTLALFAFLAACGGGGGGSVSPPAGNATPSSGPSPTATPTGLTTTAQGSVIDDATGAALAGVKVQLDPWIVYPTPGPTPTPIAISTTDPSGHFTVRAPNGTYLLVIGADAVNTPPPGFTTPNPSATDTPIPGASGWQATIHDRVVLSGQTTLVAPTMPPVPLYTPPATETGGAYRIATLSALTEAPCVLGYNQYRESLSLNPAVVDEWLVESARGYAALHNSPAYSVSTTPAPGESLLTTGNSSATGGYNCYDDVVAPAFGIGSSAQAYAENSNTLWFGGIYDSYVAGSAESAFGLGQFPIDPRVFAKPGSLNWP